MVNQKQSHSPTWTPHFTSLISADLDPLETLATWLSKLLVREPASGEVIGLTRLEKLLLANILPKTQRLRYGKLDECANALALENLLKWTSATALMDIEITAQRK